MNQINFCVLQVFLSISLAHADGTLVRPGSFFAVHRSLAALTKGSSSSNAGSNAPPLLGYSALIFKFGQLFQQDLKKADEIKKEAERLKKLENGLLRREKSVIELRDERRKKIKELKEKLSESQSTVKLKKEGQISEEEMREKLHKLLTENLKPDFGQKEEESGMTLLEARPGILEQPANSGFHVVPGMWMAPPKNSDRANNGDGVPAPVEATIKGVAVETNGEHIKVAVITPTAGRRFFYLKKNLAYLGSLVTVDRSVIDAAVTQQRNKNANGFLVVEQVKSVVPATRTHGKVTTNKQILCDDSSKVSFESDRDVPEEGIGVSFVLIAGKAFLVKIELCRSGSLCDVEDCAYKHPSLWSEPVERFILRIRLQGGTASAINELIARKKLVECGLRNACVGMYAAYEGFTQALLHEAIGELADTVGFLSHDALKKSLDEHTNTIGKLWRPSHIVKVWQEVLKTCHVDVRSPSRFNRFLYGPKFVSTLTRFSGDDGETHFEPFYFSIQDCDCFMNLFYGVRNVFGHGTADKTIEEGVLKDAGEDLGRIKNQDLKSLATNLYKALIENKHEATITNKQTQWLYSVFRAVVISTTQLITLWTYDAFKESPGIDVHLWNFVPATLAKWLGGETNAQALHRELQAAILAFPSDVAETKYRNAILDEEKKKFGTLEKKLNKEWKQHIRDQSLQGKERAESEEKFNLKKRTELLRESCQSLEQEERLQRSEIQNDMENFNKEIKEDIEKKDKQRIFSARREKQLAIFFGQEIGVSGHWYTDGEVNNVLRLRLQEEDLEGRADVNRIAPLGGTAIGNQLVTHLGAEMTAQAGLILNRTILFPYNIGNNHWVGLVIQIQDGLVTAEYFDTLTENPMIPSWVRNELQTVYGPGVTITPAANLRQFDTHACGPLMVENLVQRALGIRNQAPRFLGYDSQEVRVHHDRLLNRQPVAYAEDTVRQSARVFSPYAKQADILFTLLFNQKQKN